MMQKIFKMTTFLCMKAIFFIIYLLYYILGNLTDTALQDVLPDDLNEVLANEIAYNFCRNQPEVRIQSNIRLNR